jgi:hypothetical protein
VLSFSCQNAIPEEEVASLVPKRAILLERRRRDRQLIHRSVQPFVAFLDEHDGNIFHDGVFSAAILANQPAILVKDKGAGFFADADGAAQDF